MKIKNYISMKQVWGIVRTHLLLAIFASLMGFLMATLLAKPTGKTVFTAFMMVLYFLMMYGAASDCAIRDKKDYTEERAYPWKGTLLPIGVLVITAVLFLIYRLTWIHIVAADNAATVLDVFGNVMFVLWSYMYYGLLGLDQGTMLWQGYVVLVGFPIVASTLGYYVGYRGFDIHEKIQKLVYEKKQ